MPSQSAIDTRQRRREPVRSAAAAILLAAGATVASAALAGRWLDDGTLAWRAAVVSIGGGGGLLWLATRHLTAPTFGAANTLTLTRAALALLLVTTLGVQASPALGWLLVGVAVAAAALDGVDGALARGRGEASEFGARFDMETDALLILVLAALVWQYGKAGVWILLAGLLRYLFVAASYLWPWLGAALPPRKRRQAACVIQIVSLIGALAPAVTPPWSAPLAFVGLAALGVSFAVDVAWLARHARA
jgi:phosphatidylglycerophosphate synthase